MFKIKFHNKKALFYMLCWCISFTLLVTIIKFLSKDLARPLILWIRLLFGIIFAIPLAVSKGIQKTSQKSLLWYIIRAFIVYLAMTCTYYAYSNLPITTATAIGYTEPIIQIIIAMIFLKEKVAFRKWIFIILGYIGIYIIINPSKIDKISIAILVALCANILSSSARVITRYLTLSEPSHQMVLYGDFLLIIISSFFVIPYLKIPSLIDILLLAILGFLGYISKYCYTNASQLANINFIAPMTYMRIFLSVPIGFYLFNEIPTWMTFIGSFIIIISNYFLVTYNKKD